jgi:hypothetical protein
VQHERLTVEEAGQVTQYVRERLVRELLDPADAHGGAAAGHRLARRAGEILGHDHGRLADAGLGEPVECMAEKRAVGNRDCTGCLCQDDGLGEGHTT